jgi:hypothetical protein
MPDRTMTQRQQDQLESLVDSCGLDLVLIGLGCICAAKSDHVLVNWQDRTLAAQWMRAMTVCDKAGSDPRVMYLP